MKARAFEGIWGGIVVLYKRLCSHTRDQVWGYFACIYVFIYMIGGCALTVHCIAMTVQCVVHYCGKLQITTELQNCVLRTVELCNDLGLLCSTREKHGKGYLPIRDRGWLRLGLRHLLKRLSCKSCGDCTWCVMWGYMWWVHVIRRLYDLASKELT